MLNFIFLKNSLKKKLKVYIQKMLLYLDNAENFLYNKKSCDITCQDFLFRLQIF